MGLKRYIKQHQHTHDDDIKRKTDTTLAAAVRPNILRTKHRKRGRGASRAIDATRAALHAVDVEGDSGRVLSRRDCDGALEHCSLALPAPAPDVADVVHGDPHKLPAQAWRVLPRAPVLAERVAGLRNLAVEPCLRLRTCAKSMP
eukprot:3313114-Rhodomonas_salina.2